MYGITLLTTERRERDLEHLAGLDALTGVLNRRLFERRAVGEIAAAERHGRPLCLLLLDIDRLDAINDRHGRAAGDQVLRRLAGVGHAHLRVSDAFGRFDDDEFAVLLVDTGVGAAQLVAERMRAAFAAAPAHPAPATLSVGLARLAPDMHDLATLMRAAEAALYAAKTAGRNQVAWAEDPPRIVPA